MKIIEILDKYSICPFCNNAGDFFYAINNGIDQKNNYLENKPIIPLNMTPSELLYLAEDYIATIVFKHCRYHIYFQNHEAPNIPLKDIDLDIDLERYFGKVAFEIQHRFQYSRCYKCPNVNFGYPITIKDLINKSEKLLLLI